MKLHNYLHKSNIYLQSTHTRLRVSRARFGKISTKKKKNEKNMIYVDIERYEEAKERGNK